MLHDGQGKHSFSKYPALLELEARHGVDLGFAYYADSAISFTGYIASSQRKAFFHSLSSTTRFYSVLMDGSTDAGNKEDELMVMVYCSKNNVTREMLP